MAATSEQQIALATFVKTPGLSPVKTRLARVLGREKAESFYQLCLAATSAAMSGAKEEGYVPFWAVAEAEGPAHWKTHPCVLQGSGGLGERLAHVYAELFDLYGSVCFLGGDCPQMSQRDFQETRRMLQTHEFVMGPARDGGFYLFASRVPLPSAVFTNVTYSQSSTGRHLETELAPYGKLGHLAPKTDVDEEEDLPLLAQELSALGQLRTEAHRDLELWLRQQGVCP